MKIPCPCCGDPMRANLRYGGRIIRLMCAKCWKLVPADLRSQNRRYVQDVAGMDELDVFGWRRARRCLSLNAKACIKAARKARYIATVASPRRA